MPTDTDTNASVHFDEGCKDGVSFAVDVHIDTHTYRRILDENVVGPLEVAAQDTIRASMAVAAARDFPELWRPGQLPKWPQLTIFPSEELIAAVQKELQ